MRGTVLALAVVAVAGLLTACEPPPGAPVPDTVIDWEQDTTGVKPAGFTSADSPLVHFSDLGGTGQPRVVSIGEAFGGGEKVMRPSGQSGIGIRLDRPSNRISVTFGYDFQEFIEPGEEAVLTVFRGATQVGESRLELNRNALIDQTITFQNGPLFDRAELRYDTADEITEHIDTVRVGPLCTKAGTEASETLVGTSGDDIVCGGGGNDTISGRGGRDHITGDRGADTLNGEGDNDFVSGGPGTDDCDGGPGADTFAADAL